MLRKLRPLCRPVVPAVSRPLGRSLADLAFPTPACSTPCRWIKFAFHFPSSSFSPGFHCWRSSGSRVDFLDHGPSFDQLDHIHCRKHFPQSESISTQSLPLSMGSFIVTPNRDLLPARRRECRPSHIQLADTEAHHGKAASSRSLSIQRNTLSSSTSALPFAEHHMTLDPYLSLSVSSQTRSRPAFSAPNHRPRSQPRDIRRNRNKRWARKDER